MKINIFEFLLNNLIEGNKIHSFLLDIDNLNIILYEYSNYFNNLNYTKNYLDIYIYKNNLLTNDFILDNIEDDNIVKDIINTNIITKDKINNFIEKNIIINKLKNIDNKLLNDLDELNNIKKYVEKSLFELTPNFNRKQNINFFDLNLINKIKSKNNNYCIISIHTNNILTEYNIFFQHYCIDENNIKWETNKLKLTFKKNIYKGFVFYTTIFNNNDNFLLLNYIKNRNLKFTCLFDLIEIN